MAFSKEQIALLTAPLDKANVKSRDQAGRSLSYIEAYHAENEANRIFGFDAWDRETDLTLLGEPRLVDGKWRVGYRAKVRITVRTPDGGFVVREGCGFGSGIDRDVDQAHESALKEAESDAEKRALKTFGNPFGQALYDKTQADVVDVAEQQRAEAKRKAAEEAAAAAEAKRQAGNEKMHKDAMVALDDFKQASDLFEWWKMNYKAMKAELNDAQYFEIEKKKDALKAKFEAPANKEAA